MSTTTSTPPTSPSGTTALVQRLHGRVAIVTGAASGIGRATALRLAAEGAQVVVTAGHSHDAGRAVAAQLGTSGLYCALDVTDPAQWQAAVAQALSHFGTLDILVNNAGITIEADVETSDLALWRKVMATNLDGAFLGCQHAVAAMAERGGTIINVGSIAGLVASSQFLAYGVSKAGVEALTRSVAAHCRRKGYDIRCNVVHPGTIATPMMDEVMRQRNARGSNEAVRGGKATAAFGESDDVARLIAYLASDESRYVTGASVTIDNGLSLM